ncbi:glycoside hydrolase family 2 TIM barrel-domain containing protein [Aromatoleum diolicum]|uniref:Glycoside hydrolase family 2 catalytic domain-containing protein n=1 Tax=Aromatoleum diolicum TaxID=75796 RepID=A0ABX1QBP2_9RHOO|nr:glycoside hydrolase family 2 TIM barrel-domain containing protein [Aromatoleum diolicum]NMG75818.1 hypothetical protein [Aromatoleum diolicum]
MRLKARETFARLLTRLTALLLLAAAPVSATAADAQWQGAAFAGDRSALEKLAAAGAGVVRVYGESDVWVLDEAQRLGLRVVMGLSVGYPRHGIQPSDADALGTQEEAIRRFVLRHHKHPALLAWGVGNEVEAGADDPLPAWREVNRLAGMIKAIDPAHPTLMVVVDGGVERLALLAKCCANIDLLGINAYAGAAFTLPQRLRSAGITKPVVIGELGPLGQWQSGRKPWGAPVEPTSSEKAAFFRDVFPFLRSQPQIVGAFPFLWGWKQEQTETWHGLLLADGSLTAMSDALSTAWGKPVTEPAPLIRGIGIAADEFAPGQEISAGVDAAAFDGSALRTEWKVLAEATDLRGGSGVETPPARIAVPIRHADAASVRFIAPQQPGAYRLFITIHDRKGKAATANLPFLVR